MESHMERPMESASWTGVVPGALGAGAGALRIGAMSISPHPHVCARALTAALSTSAALVFGLER